jgi:hypothetical protein
MSEKSTATRLVDIAKDLYSFGCVSEQHDDPRVTAAVYTYACPKNNPDVKRPLAEIRPDLADVFTATYHNVPNATALGDAMTVLEGMASKEAPVEASPGLLALLAGGKSSVATRLVEMAKQRFTLGVTTTAADPSTSTRPKTIPGQSTSTM